MSRSRSCGGGLCVVLGAAREVEQQLRVLLAGQRDGEPAHEAEVDVVAHLEAELAAVEVERLVLVEDVDAGDPERGDV